MQPNSWATARPGIDLHDATAEEWALYDRARTIQAVLADNADLPAAVRDGLDRYLDQLLRAPVEGEAIVEAVTLSDAGLEVLRAAGV